MSDHPAEPVYRDALAEAHRELSAIFDNQQQKDRSEWELKAAARIWEALSREQPEVGRFRSKLADAHSSLGYLYSFGERYGHQPRLDEAEAELWQAQNAAERLAREHPEVSAYEALLATILQRRGLLQSRGDRSSAEESFERAVEIAGSLARTHPKTKIYQVLFAKNLKTLGVNCTRMGNFSQAEKALKAAIAVLEKLVADHPQDIQIANELGTEYLYYQELLRSGGHGESAMEWSVPPIRLFRSLASRDPRNFETRELLWESIAEQGETLMRLGRYPEALADFDELVQSAQDTRSLEVYWAFHALAKARLGDLSELAHMEHRVRDVLSVPDPDSAARYHMLFFDEACLAAALAKLARDDRVRPPAQQTRSAQADLDRALAFLDRARAVGEFQRDIRPDEVQRERLLDPLRSDPRFQLLMMDLEFPDDPFGRRLDQDTNNSTSL